MMSRFTLIFIFLTSAFVGAQETLMRKVHDTRTDTHVEVLALFTNPAPAGFLPVRITVANNQTRGHRIELRSQVSNIYGSSGGTQSSAVFSVSAEAGKVVTRDVLVPTMPGLTTHAYGSNLELFLSGTMGRDEHQYYQNYSSATPRVLLSHRLYTANASALDGAANSVFGGHRGSGELSSRFDPKQLPSDWQAYGAYDWMILTDEEWAEIPGGQRNAILAWVRLGGHLNIRHRMESFERGRLGLPEDAGYGSITSEAVAADLSLDAMKVVRGLVVDGMASRGRSLSEDFERIWPLQQGFEKKDFRFGMFIVVLTVFMIVVGPVNLFFLAPAGRRHRLFVTTPLISLGASLVMVLLIVFQDGVGGKGRRVVLMEVRPDDGQHAAFIHQEQFSRAGILMHSGFEVSMPALMSPVPIAHSRWARYTNRHDASGAFNMQPRASGMAASGDWFQSRSEQGQFITAVVPTRGRIEDAGDGALISSFPHVIDVLFFLDEGGEWHVAENVRTGQRSKLKPMSVSAVEQRIQEEAGSYFTKRLSGMLRKVQNRRGHFVAIADGAPGIDTHKSIRWESTRTVITGPVVRP